MEQWLLAAGALALIAFALSAPWPKRRRMPSYCSAAGCLLVLAALLLRWYSLGRPPWATLYETAAVLALATGILSAYCYLRRETPALYLPLAAVSVALLAFSAASWEASPSPSPELNSGFLFVHVPMVIISYGMFAVSGAAAAAFIALKATKNGDEKTFKRLDSVSHKAIAAGLALLIPGIAMGALWAKTAWGDYWSWDPKETWSFITAVIYAVYLVARKTGIRPEDAAFFSVLGLLSMLFTYLGVSYLIHGLHGFAG